MQNFKIVKQILILILVILLMKLLISQTTSIKDERFEDFDKAIINGTIVNIRQTGYGEYLKIDTHYETYVFRSMENKEYNSNFTNLANKGDSVQKDRYGEFIKLTKPSGNSIDFKLQK